MSDAQAPAIGGPPSCKSCGRVRWSGDRFCAACGTEYSEGSLESYHDLGEPASVTSDDTSTGSSRRDAMVGLAVLALVIAGVAAVFALGGDSTESTDSADEVASDQDLDTLAASSPRVAPEPTRPIPQPQPHEGPAPGTYSTPRPGSVAYPIPTPGEPSEYVELVEVVRSIDMGGGWMIMDHERGTTIAINLDTGEVVALNTGDSERGRQALALPQGVMIANYASLDDPEWRLTPWSNDPDATSREIDGLKGDILAAFMDETVGPVVVTSTFGDSFDVQAWALELDEAKPVPFANSASAFAASIGRSGVLQAPSTAFWSDDGSDVYRWTWADGWIKVTSGQVGFETDNGAGVLRCTRPDLCEGTIVDRDGTEYGSFDASKVETQFSFNRLNPERTLLATTGFLRSGVSIVSLNDETTASIYESRDRRRHTHTWSPNGRYLVLTDDNSVSALDVESGELRELFRAPNTGEAGVVFLDEIDLQ